MRPWPMKMRFGTRTFLLSFVPFALLLAVGFWSIQNRVQATVRDGLRSSLRDNHLAIARARSRNEVRNRRVLKVIGENSALKAGIQLLLANRNEEAARATVDDQLRELCARMEVDLLLVSAPDGAPLIGVAHRENAIHTVDAARSAWVRNGLQLLEGRALQISSVPIDQTEENIGLLSVGESLDLGEFTTPVALMRGPEVLKTNLDAPLTRNLSTALRGCGGHEECEIVLDGSHYISLPIDGMGFGNGYILRSLQNVDAAAAPVQTALARVFVGSALAAGLLALLCGFFSSRAIIRPLGDLVDHLRGAARTGELRETTRDVSSIQEIAELTESFNRAAASVRDAREGLQAAYVEFAASLANALEARDRYTAGHSQRVSRLAYSVAEAMGLSSEECGRVRVGALLHDIGKIGVPDNLLQKAGSLTAEEFAQIKRHPVIGRRILEAVQGFAPYLPAVELHHENWDGTGYPHGQRGEETPIDARIIHVADAYDAMTTDRPYRRGMSHETAIAVLRQHAGTQFDPRAVDAFASLDLTADLLSGEPHMVTAA